jgi:hypothetical protein
MVLLHGTAACWRDRHSGVVLDQANYTMADLCRDYTVEPNNIKVKKIAEAIFNIDKAV